MKGNLLEKTLHCDGYYAPKICPSLGDIDYGETGLKRLRRICNTNGQCPLTKYNLCPHCVELKSFLRNRSRNRNSKIHTIFA